MEIYNSLRKRKPTNSEPTEHEHIVELQAQARELNKKSESEWRAVEPSDASPLETVTLVQEAITVFGESAVALWLHTFQVTCPPHAGVRKKDFIQICTSVFQANPNQETVRPEEIADFFVNNGLIKTGMLPIWNIDYKKMSLVNTNSEREGYHYSREHYHALIKLLIKPE